MPGSKIEVQRNKTDIYEQSLFPIGSLTVYSSDINVAVIQVDPFRLGQKVVMFHTTLNRNHFETCHIFCFEWTKHFLTEIVGKKRPQSTAVVEK